MNALGPISNPAPWRGEELRTHPERWLHVLRADEIAELSEAARTLQRAGKPQRLGLDAPDQAALVAFLKTLTDIRLIEDERFSDPFRR